MQNGSTGKISLKFDSERDRQNGRTIRFSRAVETDDLRGQIVALVHAPSMFDVRYGSENSRRIQSIQLKFIEKDSLPESLKIIEAMENDN